MTEPVKSFILLGPLPSKEAPVDVIRRNQEAISLIHGPITDEEAVELRKSFGPDDCFGLAWTLLHLIETAPNGASLSEEPPTDANMWLHTLWGRARKGLHS